MRKLIPFFLFFLIFISCQAPSGPEFTDNYGDTWERSAAGLYDESSEADVIVFPGDHIQSIVDNSPDSSKIFFNPGIYRSQSIQPKDGMTFIALSPATGNKTILHGENQTKFGFHNSTYTAENVRISNLIIEYYVPGEQMGAIKAGGHQPGQSNDGWVIENVEMRYNNGSGIRTGSNMEIIGGSTHHNFQTGIVGAGDNILIESVEIFLNNQDKRYDYKVEAGGIKLVLTNNAVIRNNYIYRNFGPGIWTDINNHNVLIEKNYVEDNAAAGIFQEIGGSAIIRLNVVRRNGLDRRGEDGPYGAGIQIGHSGKSGDIEVYENILVDNKNGIIGIQQERLDHGGPHILDNLHVHHNTIVQQNEGTWAAGVYDGIGDGEVFTRNITFENNTYILRSLKNSFRWKDKSISWIDWQNSGHDHNGKLE